MQKCTICVQQCEVSSILLYNCVFLLSHSFRIAFIFGHYYCVDKRSGLRTADVHGARNDVLHFTDGHFTALYGRLDGTNVAVGEMSPQLGRGVFHEWDRSRQFGRALFCVSVLSGRQETQFISRLFLSGSWTNIFQMLVTFRGFELNTLTNTMYIMIVSYLILYFYS